MTQCDPVTGACTVPDVKEAASPTPVVTKSDMTVHYVGDPMCSWCWGISPAVKAAEAYCKQQGLAFAVTVGGLRVGGGDPWTPEFRQFLRTEWLRISKTSGQPIGFKLLDAEQFDYDTEPACRAVVTVQLLQMQRGLPESLVLRFYTAVQRKFYVEGEDTRKAAFYASICADEGLDFNEFKTLFESPRARQATVDEFAKRHRWGVSSFPTLLIEHDGQMQLLSSGFVRTEQLLAKLEGIVEPASTG